MYLHVFCIVFYIVLWIKTRGYCIFMLQGPPNMPSFFPMPAGMKTPCIMAENGFRNFSMLFMPACLACTALAGGPCFMPFMPVGRLPCAPHAFHALYALRETTGKTNHG